MNLMDYSFNRILASDKYHLLRDTESYLGYQFKRLRAYIAVVCYEIIKGKDSIK